MAEGREKRRLAAILVADVVGYSRLMASDESGTLARLKAMRAELLEPKVAGYDGRIVKTTGDGFLIEFASVVDAVHCAIAVQRELGERAAGVPEDRRMVLRVGINLG
ncbi:MAG: adenylate/guanylate cyclase domain-containing protein, partial [Alphaproteobacteria bacterium]|nr:adenylate/guanylate cyclase domain-containing protein [Alphaproteobacteria bacterium]